ncbi:hypothetical protein FHT86_001718 [Rhizobium sp. BK313]|uniref:hypothetical protein n=1 Tax=Rhizobium sp. BK313 TaxID=2587081 RepID=UPI0010617119|nr:hypothetical protein [Rhizobium sp. BK313]MBB3453462.1 hypothetical protein [Rhizobium sp. BK313]
MESLMSGRLLFVTLLALAAAACPTQGETRSGSASSGDVAVPTISATTPRNIATAARSQQKVGRFFIEFRSRYALSYGHTYVIFGRMGKTGNIIDREVAGLHPASNSALPYILGHYIPVPAETGESDGDLDDRYRSASWRVTLNEQEYKKVVAYIRKLQASSRFWQATVSNCNAFVGKIARSMGYKTPGIWLRPQLYVVKLREMNGGPNAVGYTGPPG